mmetsp:Transcript_6694/g.13625  ORF Transcript_6694/g.13625 Transcript_6694/m.13625 type:complete len:263 (+) Transcript_6694:14-802(+)
MLVPIVKLTGSLVTGILAFSSARNILQTTRAVSEIEETVARGLEIQDHLTNIELRDEHDTAPWQLTEDACFAAVVEEMQKLSRKDILSLFVSCPSVDGAFELLDGEWNAVLLDNNGWIMTNVASFMTNQLFGRGSRWIGKTFNSQSSLGTNRFKGKVDVHPFDFAIEASKLLHDDAEDAALSGKSCIVLDYSPHQNPISLWKTMRDELRFVPLPSKSAGSDQNGKYLMVGMGSLAWSGGLWNGTPFCLYREQSSMKNSHKKQ